MKTNCFSTKPGTPSAWLPLTLALAFALAPVAGLRAEIIGHWRLDGNVLDSVAGRHGGVVGNAYAWQTANQVGGTGALTLNPADERSTFVELGNALAFQFGAGDFTVSYWVKKLVHSVNWAGAYGVCKWSAGANAGANEWTLSLLNGPNDDQPTFAVEIGGTSYAVTQPSELILGNWHHLVGVRRGNSLELYVDGALAAQGPLPAGASINSVGRSLQIGTSAQGPAFGASAVYDDLQLYNHALRLEDIAFLNANPGQALPAAPGNFSIPWHTVDGGGGSSTGSLFRVTGTIGQPDASSVSHTGGVFRVTGGFWALPVAIQTEGGPVLAIAPAGPGQARISWTPATPGFVLQEATTLSPPNWVNSPSGALNPVTVPAAGDKFYRLRKP